MLDVLRFWLERDVDGFRIDVAHFIMKDPQLRDNPLKKKARSELHKSLGDYDTQIHQYDQDHADIHPLYREIRQLLDAYSQERPRFAIGEIHIFDWERWAKYYGQTLDELHMPYNFQLLGIDLQVDKVQRVIEALEQALPPGAWPNYVLGNHDEMRIASRYNEQQARLAAMLLLTLRGTPTIYYGDEIGMQEVAISPDQQQDPWGIQVPGLGRDGCRTPMQWDDQRHAGFSPPDAGQTWLPIAEDYQEHNVAIQLEKTTSMLSLYRRLLAIRKSFPALQVGDFTRIEHLHEHCFAYQRSLGDAPENLILMNFADQELILNTGFSGNFSMVVSTYLDRVGEVDISQLLLRKHEGVIIERKPNNSNAFS
jgi:alpha-glucosidase